MNDFGIVLVSHSQNIAKGLFELINEIAKNVSITYAGGVDNGIGTSFDTVLSCIEGNNKNKILAFYDLGSAKINLENVKEFTSKKIKIYDVPFVEGSYTAAALLQVGTAIEVIEDQLSEIKLNK